ncbi:MULTISPECIES: helix-turn-helix domain-containing protein [Lysinibacillus]|uniref:Helix-turn-helix domain-containing protein n=1 Tax=Lysinibacillus xylanilyticus TaxID=582475 RepID=A0ABV3VYC7_9BACI
MNINDAIRTRIQQLCNEKGWLINELIRRSNVHQPTVSEFMRGKTKSPSIITITKISKGFELTLSEFFNDEIFLNLEEVEN